MFQSSPSPNVFAQENFIDLAPGEANEDNIRDDSSRAIHNSIERYLMNIATLQPYCNKGSKNVREDRRVALYKYIKLIITFNGSISSGEKYEQEDIFTEESVALIEELIQDVEHIEDCDFMYAKQKFVQSAVDLVFSFSDKQLKNQVGGMRRDFDTLVQ